MNKKLIARLRAQRKTHLDRMETLAKVETGESPRSMTDAEKSEYANLQADVAEIDGQIAELEKEPAAPANPAPAPANAVQLAREAVTAERNRTSGIKKAVAVALAMCPALAQGNVTAESLTQEFVDGDRSEEFTRSELMNRIAAEHAKQPATVAQNRGGVVNDEREKFRAQMEAAVMLRVETKPDEKTRELGRRFVGLSLMEMAREYLRYAGVDVVGLTKDKVAQIALNGQFGYADYFAGGMHSTSDFPNILANVANKRLRQAYDAYPSTFKLWARQATATDFKPKTNLQLSDMGPLRKINEGGEYKRRTISDSKQAYALDSYGEIIGITRRVIINDDLDAFSRLPQLFGQAAAQMEGDIVYAILTAGQTMTETNTTLFHASHSNLNTTNPFDDDALKEARRKMLLQTGPKGTVLGLMLKYIIVPAALLDDAEQIVYPIGLAPTTVGNVIPEWMRNLIVVAEPRLDANSQTSWYGAADSARIDTIEYCYLEGEQGLIIDNRQGWDVDGIEVKAREDFAAAAIDFRGLCKNTA